MRLSVLSMRLVLEVRGVNRRLDQLIIRADLQRHHYYQDTVTTTEETEDE